MAERVIFDAAPVIGFARGDKRVAAIVAQAAARDVDLVIPPVVVTQTLRGGGRDAPIHRLLAGAVVPPAHLRLARLAGELLGQTGGRDVADAQIAAEAIMGPPCLLISDDAADLGALTRGHPGIRVRPIGSPEKR